LPPPAGGSFRGGAPARACPSREVTTINTGYLDGQHPFPQRTHLSVLFATFQLELFDLIVKWVDFAKAEIATWPTTEGLGLTDRTEAILNSIKERRSVLEPPSDAS
jgi:hypothetical protein